MPKIPDRLKLEKSKVLIRYTTNKDPKTKGVYACRVPGTKTPLCIDKFLFWDGQNWRYPGLNEECFFGDVVGWLGPLERVNGTEVIRDPGLAEPRWGIKNVLKGSYGWKFGPVRTAAECKEVDGVDGDVICLMSMNGAYSEYEWIDSPSGGKWCDVIPF
jgi:hypothetical protein